MTKEDIAEALRPLMVEVEYSPDMPVATPEITHHIYCTDELLETIQNLFVNYKLGR